MSLNPFVQFLIHFTSDPTGPDATPLLGNNFRAGYNSSYRITKILVSVTVIYSIGVLFFELRLFWTPDWIIVVHPT